MSSASSTDPVSYYPAMLDLRGRPCVVVGGGSVAEQKVGGLIAAGALVTVIAPGLTPTLADWHSDQRMKWLPRDYRDGDLAGAFLVFAATDSSQANRRVWEEAEQRAIPINAADDPTNCSFILPAIHRDGDLIVAVSSGGRAPAVAMRIRDRIAEELGDGYGPYLQLLGSLRTLVTTRHRTFEERRKVWHRIARSDALDRVRAGNIDAARRVALELIAQTESSIDHLSAQGLIARVLDKPGRAAISCSFQASGLVLLHMLRRFEPDIPVLFIDTGYHFPETLELRDQLTREWKLNLINLTPEQSVAEQEAQFGPLYRLDPDRCCNLRKVEPLHQSLEGFDIWFTGLRRHQAVTRSTVRKVERKLLPSGRVVEKVNPLVDWTTEQIFNYLADHLIPHHPLYDLGFTSIGCSPCTAIPHDPTNPRSGRWGGTKLECGIHVLGGEAP
jgi:phosphoadenosine phosphosulfate reductase